jgi:hypothetical protein
MVAPTSGAQIASKQLSASDVRSVARSALDPVQVLYILSKDVRNSS